MKINTANNNSVFSVFNRTYDAYGNATSVQTSTGTVITMSFDSQGRRTEYKSVTNGAQNTWLRFLYDGYLCVQVLYSNEPYNVFKEFTWDPSQPVATRPLAIQKDGTWFTYGYDLTKNICEVFGPAGYIRTAYAYAPFGAVTASDNGVSQPFHWSSEVYDSELDLVYYNYRHYSPSLGRFLSRDPIEEHDACNDDIASFGSCLNSAVSAGNNIPYHVLQFNCSHWAISTLVMCKLRAKM